MADPETSSRKKSKRKRWAALSDPEEVTEEIMNELQSSRDGIDKKLAKFNHSFMETQSRKRRLFIESCNTRLSGLPDNVRPIVAERLLSSEDFNVEMNYSEVHTSSSNSLLTWSCTDESLSDPSWRACESWRCSRNVGASYGADRRLTIDLLDLVLQSCAEGTPAFSSPRAATLARATRATSKASSSRAQSSTPIAEPPSHPKSTRIPDPDMAGGLPAEYSESDEDPLSTSPVTIPRSRTARNQEVVKASLRDSSSSTGKGPDAASKQIPSKRVPRHSRRWSQQECLTLKNLCYGKNESLSQNAAPFWEDVSAQLPGRTAIACYMKSLDLRRRGKLRKHESTGGPLRPRQRWSAEELQKLAQCRPQPGESCDWSQVATQLPGRTARACYMQCQKLGFTDLKGPTGVRSQGGSVWGAEESDGESGQGNMTTREGGGDTRNSPHGENLAAL